MTLSTHVLDVEEGRPLAGVPVRVERWRHDGAWESVASGTTGADGRALDLVAADVWGTGRWRLVFDTAAVVGADAFWPEVSIDFAVADDAHHHIPLLLARHGYTTYRGS